MTYNKNMNPTYVVSLIVSLSIVGWGLLFPASFEAVGNALFSYISNTFGWFYSAVMFSFVVFVVWIGFFSKYKNIKLGPDDSKPEYSNISWFAMLFSAGMGIGLVFWGAAEPLNYWLAPVGADPTTAEAARFAINKSFLHWGLHPWANYSVVALALAYMQFRKNKPGLISTLFIPLLGEDVVNSKIGIAIDVLAIFATIAGVATSLGLGAYQINSGLNFLFGIPEDNMSLIVIIAVVTVLFIISAVTGLDKGIKFLSNLNVSIALVIAIGAAAIGGMVPILRTLVEGTGDYINQFVYSSLQTGAHADAGWFGGWTIFYWAWWIAWCPFSAIFIARISKGRTIKEFVTGVLLAPTAVSFVWFAVFGTMSINTGVEVATEAIQSTSTALFVVLQQYQFGNIISFVVIILLCTFFITSADSATFVLGMLSSRGDLNPTTQRKVIWGLIQSALALALMLGSANGLQMLQTVSIVAAFPFAIIMMFCMYSFVKVLKQNELCDKPAPKQVFEEKPDEITEKSVATSHD